jgi:hypothetical protein
VFVLRQVHCSEFAVGTEIRLPPSQFAEIAWVVNDEAKQVSAAVLAAIRGMGIEIVEKQGS